jgi:O-acetyl-ADP-ribose deacetylase (regulator of RNase III)
MTIKVEKGDITQMDCEAIVNPANSYGYMGGGVAEAIKRVGGDEIETEAILKSPIPIGKAIPTTAGTLRCKLVIHAPTMKQPAMKIDVKNVESATRAALQLASELRIKRIAIPGMGTGVGGVSAKEAAKAMINVAKEFENEIEDIILVGINDELVDAFKQYL